ncbi:hypothetical protein F1712_04170 [Streptococcus pneumoniae]|nr:hypothetical protein CGSSp18BS74_08390 [Streptococcus pneumoniae SP18-BS74]KAA3421852.1 hypothetical protein F1712_04170 [Streptococcus pneumoniae]RJP92521.1 hypothetical protein C5O07_01320 [Streptococcus pneumoniae]TNW45873.1 hypothetical protein FIU69_10160 [Streptococcus pneumoniae]
MKKIKSFFLFFRKKGIIKENKQLHSMEIEKQTRKLAAGCSKHCFEVVNRTDEVSSKYCFEVADGS